MVATLDHLTHWLQPPAVTPLALPHIRLFGGRVLDLSRRRVHTHKHLHITTVGKDQRAGAALVRNYRHAAMHVVDAATAVASLKVLMMGLLHLCAECNCPASNAGSRQNHVTPQLFMADHQIMPIIRDSPDKRKPTAGIQCWNQHHQDHQAR